MLKIVRKHMTKKFLEPKKEKTAHENDPVTQIQKLYKHGRKWKGNWNDKPIPIHLSMREKKTLKRVMNFAHILDSPIHIIGPISYSWSFVYGLCPVIGDFLDAILAAIIVIIIMRVVPWRDGKKQPDHQKLESRMLVFMWIQVFALFAIGLVPIGGDIVDSLLQCNKRNAKMIYNHLQKLSDSRGPGWTEVTPNKTGRVRPLQSDQSDQSGGLGIQMSQQSHVADIQYPSEMGERVDSHRRDLVPHREFSHHAEDTQYATNAGDMVDVRHADTQRMPYTLPAERVSSPAKMPVEQKIEKPYDRVQRRIAEANHERESRRQMTRGRNESPSRYASPSPRPPVISPQPVRAPKEQSNGRALRNIFGGSREIGTDLERGEVAHPIPPQRPPRDDGNWL